jgi:hypothetical protein
MNSTTSEASAYWHPQVVRRTRCTSLLPPAPDEALAGCLLNLTSDELLDAMPPDWTAEAGSYTVFRSDFQYSPLLLVDGPGGVLPYDYLTAAGRPRGPTAAAPQSPVLPDFPVVIGVARQDFDFGPGEDVRNLTRSGFASFVRGWIEPAYGVQFATSVLELYRIADGPAPWEPQRLFAEILTDATFLCPSLDLGVAMQRSFTHPVYNYALSQTLSEPFCVPPFEDMAMSPPYCPRYAFHSLDELFWFQPGYNASNFQYDIRSHPDDLAFAGLLGSRLGDFVNTGSVDAWSQVLPPNAPPAPPDTLPRGFSVVDFRLPDAKSVVGLKADQCNFWLQHRFYETKALIN